jgi:rod shape-determining protein MreD
MRALLILTMAGGSVAHATLTPLVTIAGVTPDVPLIMVVLLALRRGPEFGSFTGFVTGLMQDLAGGGLIGVQALTKSVIGFGIGVAGARLRVSQPLVQVPGLVVLTIVEGLARFALLQIFRFPAPFGELMMYVVLPQALCNGFIGAAFVLTLAWAQTLRDHFEGSRP